MAKGAIAVACVVAVVAITMPAQAADPVRQQLAALKRQVAALQAKVRKSEAQTRAFRARAEARESDTNLLRSFAARTTDCPVTTPNRVAPPGATPSDSWHGSSRLAVALWTSVVVPGDGARRSDGAVAVKYGWWRGIDGNLTIRGRRVDGPAPPIAHDGSDGYGDRGFQPSLIAFPQAGCWEITGTVGDESVTATLLFVR